MPPVKLEAKTVLTCWTHHEDTKSPGPATDQVHPPSNMRGGGRRWRWGLLETCCLIINMLLNRRRPAVNLLKGPNHNQ